MSAARPQPARLIAEAARRLGAARGWREPLDALLPMLGEGLGVDRVYVFRVHEVAGRGLGQTCVADWAREGLATLADDPRNIDETIPEEDATFRDWVERRRRGETIQGLTRDLTGYLRADFEHQRIRAFLSTPIMADGGWWGHVGLDDCRRARRWSESERATLEAVAALIGAAVERAEGGLSEAMRAAMVAASPDAVIVIDEDGGTLEFNPAAETMFGVSRADALGRPIAETVTPEHLRDQHRCGFRRYIAGAPPRIIGRRVATEGRRADGSLFPIELTVTEVRAEGRRLFAAYVRDLTRVRDAERELARQREALHQNEKLSALGSLLAGVAHELNNPLSVVVGRAVLLEEESADPAQADQLRRLREAAERCAKISRNFLAMARKSPAAGGACRLSDAVAAALDMTGYALKSSGVEVRLDLAETPPVRGDVDQLAQVLTNLLINAEQAMRAQEGPREIAIRSRREDERVWCEVADNGPGVPEATRTRIFEPFFTTKGLGAGTGVGLSVSRGIALAAGGELALRNSDRGAIFRLTLPVAVEAAEAPAALPPSDRAGSGLRLLIVDDEPEVAALIADVARREGHVASVAANGHEALERIDMERFDGVFCDVRMPMMDGPAFLRRLRETRPDLARRTVFVTGDLSDPRLSDAAIPVLAKPMDPAALREAMARLAAAVSGERPRLAGVAP